MTDKKVPFTKERIEKIIEKYPTPFHIYDEKAILDNAKAFLKAFGWAKGFREYFAVKALPNPYIMRLLSSIGIGADCSSIAELYLSERAGIRGDMIMFTSNDTPAPEFRKARELGAIINLDDITHIEYLEKAIGSLPELICFRHNPGSLKAGNAIIGKPEEAKYGLTREQMKEAYLIASKNGCSRFAMHTMVASNELNPEYFAETALILFKLAREIYDEYGFKMEFINLGGGVGIPYRPKDNRIEWEDLSARIEDAYKGVFPSSHYQPKIYFELGRAITGPYGYLVTKAIHEKRIYKNYIGTDACMANLMRPALYGSYHHITVMGKEKEPCKHRYDVTGSLCENNDKFAINRKLPKIDTGDILVIHDTGAHGHAMGFNYNGKLRSAELVLKEDGSVEMIRRAETLEDLFATLKF